ncbi:class I SAM-dependent methyltransferase [Paracidovorax anthurii]|uniref:Leucine carboxyl methyltransferase n=1 Tax=Paracidovorax anthurii TaxID=78229 RepID=A0A328ZA10_9BURK|nr:leucine carboxyl methyltransferase [Paracidovorax anthurii]
MLREGLSGLEDAWYALRGSSVTLALTLSARASPLARQIDAQWEDAWAERLLEKCPWDLRPVANDESLVRAIVVRSRIFDDHVRDACAQEDVHAVVSVGAGLCTRWGRLAGVRGVQRWIDVDLPEVIALRRLLLEDGARDSRFVACSLSEPAWLDAIPWQRGRLFVVLLEGVAPYVPEAAIQGMLQALARRARQEDCRCRVVLDYLHRDFVPVAALQAGPAVLPVVSGFRDASELDSGRSGFRVVHECEPFGLFSDGHRRFESDYRMRHGHAPYAVACLQLER